MEWLKFESVGNIFRILRPYINPKDINEEYLSAENYYGLYYDISAKIRPRSILEIGVRFGYSAVAMLLGYPTKYVGIDNESYEIRSNEYAFVQISRASCDKVILFKADTQGVNRLDHIFGDRIDEIPAPFDLIHVDGAHHSAELLHDLDLVLPFTREGSYIMVDDTEHPAHTELKETCRAWANEYGFPYKELDSYRGMTIMRRMNGS